MGQREAGNRNTEQQCVLLEMKGHGHPVNEADVVVVGASTAGLFAAYLLARQGHQVRLVDQRQRLGPPQRTLIVTDQINQVLDFDPYEAVINHIDEIELLSQNRRAVVKLGAPDLVLEREKLIQLLADKAHQEGVEIELGTSFRGLTENGDGLRLVLNHQDTGEVKEVEARVLIGADGVKSQVARAVGDNGLDKVSIFQARVVLPPGNSEHTVRVWFHKESTPFFCWLIPESKHSGVIGLVCEDPERAKGSLGQFLDEYGFEALEFQAADVALHRPSLSPSSRLEGVGVFLVGDAGGHVKVSTVGGVVTGLKGARSVAETISLWLNGTDYHKYMGSESRALRRELGLHFLMRYLLNRFRDSDYDHLLDLLDDRTTGVLQAYTRDELAETFFRLLLAQPRLLPLAVRSLVRIGNGKLRS